jgi:glutaredoxin 3
MSDEVVIYGKDSCPYTAAAIEEYQGREVPYRYVNVKKDRAELERMLALTGGRRQVPVIVEAGQVTIGFGGT